MFALRYFYGDSSSRFHADAIIVRPTAESDTHMFIHIFFHLILLQHASLSLHKPAGSSYDLLRPEKRL
jgi:hypothetical protein